MSFHLVVAKGRHQGKAVLLKHSPFIIGRHKSCQLCAASMEISRQHCSIEIGEVLRIKDLGSTNGTYVNHKKLDGERQLHDNDLLQIGPLLLTVRLEAAPITADTQPGIIAATDTQPGVDQPTPIPAALVDEEDAATMLLQLDDLPPAAEPEPEPEPVASSSAKSAAQRILEQYKKSK